MDFWIQKKYFKNPNLEIHFRILNSKCIFIHNLLFKLEIFFLSFHIKYGVQFNIGVRESITWRLQE